MLKAHVLWFSVVCFVLCGSSNAGVVTQTFNFTDTKSGAGSGTFINANSSGATFTVNPFNTSLGTLDSFTFAWSLGMTGNGVGDAGGGSMSISYGGTTYVNTTSYNGGGAGDSTGGIGTFSTLSKSSSITNNFTPANAGSTYDPAILATVTGGSAFSMSYNNGPSADTAYSNYTNVVSATSTFTTDLTVTYNYTGAPASVPEPSFAVAGAALAAAMVVVRRRRAARHTA